METSIAGRARFKAEIARKRNVNPTGLKIIFAGQELPDTITLGVSEIIIALTNVYQSSFVNIQLVYLLSMFVLCCFEDAYTFVFKSQSWSLLFCTDIFSANFIVS